MPGIAHLKLVAFLAVLVQAVSASAAEPVSHRAIYDIVLTSARSTSGIVAVTGEMLAEWAESCEGWTLDHRSIFDITYAQGATVRVTSAIATWESHNGLDYRFSVRNAADGKPTERFEGQALLSAPGAVGRVAYTEPRKTIKSLPAGVVFPMVHTLRVLAAADEAPTIVTMMVFDGLSGDGTFRVGAAIGPPRELETGMAEEFKDLRGRRSWPLQLAYFKVAGYAPEPEHEIGMRMYDNGVADRMLLDFGDFKVRADLVRLEIGRKPPCRTGIKKR